MTGSDDSDEVEFTGGVRGRFHKPGAVLVPPVHLDPDVLAVMRGLAAEMGVALDEVVNERLRKSLETA
jgi:hypothetical protein